jgi:cell division protein FtsL
LRPAATAFALLLAFASAMFLYALSYDTRRLEARVQSLERTAERTESEIAATRAELSHLSRPERIEPLARALGLKAPAPRQFVTEDQLPYHMGPRP